MSPTSANAFVVSAVGLLSKAWLYSPFCKIHVEGFELLAEVLKSSSRKGEKPRGVVTIANHVSVLDDPVIWGILPTRWYRDSHLTRTALGASDICFTNPLFSAFFRRGNVLQTIRGHKDKKGGGIYQPAVTEAIQRLDRGAWVHLFGEGKVNQLSHYLEDPTKPGHVRLPRFRWGVGRMLMEAAQPPVIIPMWLTGFDQLMPEGRKAPYKFKPRIGAELGITFGEPMDHGLFEGMLEENWKGTRNGKEVADVRIRVTEVLRLEVEKLGKRVSGNRLGKPP